MRARFIILGLTIAALTTFVALSGCAGPLGPAREAGERGHATPTGVLPEQPDEIHKQMAMSSTETTMIAEGKALFTKACAACHGADGEGTDLAPMIAGHSASATRVQVRNPLGKMPAFSGAQLSDTDLDKIGAFIASLGPAVAPAKDWEKAPSEVVHLWMALLAVKGNDSVDARHHLEDALAYIKEPERKTRAETALGLLRKGNLHHAEREIEEMVRSRAPSDVTRERLHLVLAERAIEEKDAAEVKHQLDHFVARATDGQKLLAKQALEKVAKNHFHEALHDMEQLINC